MASIVNYTGDGTTDTYNITFDYIDANDVVVTVNDVSASFSFLTDSSIQLAAIPASGDAIVIKRDTPVAALVNFTDGSTLFETELDLSAEQSRFLSEEARDRADDALTQIGANIANINRVAEISTDVTAVGNIQAEVTALAGITSDITSLGAVASDVDLLGDYTTEIETVSDDLNAGSFTAGTEYDFGLITDASSGSTGSPDGFIVTVYNNMNDIQTVANQTADLTAISNISADVSTVANSAADIGTVSSNIADISAVASNAANISAVGSNSANINAVANDAVDIGTVATNIASVNTAASNMAAISTVNSNSADISAVAANATNINQVASDTADINALGPISTDLQLLADIEDGTTATNTMQTVAGISSDVTSVAAQSSNISAVSANNANISTVAGISSDVSTVAGDSSSIQTVASNLSSINDFADKYRIGATDPTTDNDAGDLFYNTTSNSLKVWTGSAWESGATAGSGFLATTGGTMTGTLGVTTVDWGDWTITESGGSLYFATNGTNKMKLDASGNLDVAGSVNANATIT